MNIKRVYLTAHLSPTHTHTRTHLVHTKQDELWTKNIADTQTFLVFVEGNLRPVDVLEPLSGTEPQGGTSRPLFLTRLQKKNKKNMLTNWNVLLSSPSIPVLSCYITIGLDWTSKTNEKSNFADIFCGCFCWNPRRCGRLPFPLSVLLQEYWLFTANGSPLPNRDFRRKTKYSLQQFLFV